MIFLLTLSASSFAQKAKIEVNDKSIITIISAIGNDEIFTEIGNLKFSEIKEILFEVYESKYSSLYAKLQIKVPVKFGDGTGIGEMSKASIPIVVNDLSNYSDSSPEDYLIKGSKSALIGMGLTGLGAVVAIIGANSEIGENGEASIAGGVLALVGVGFVADGWSKIGKAGKTMKSEKAKKNKSN